MVKLMGMSAMIAASFALVFAGCASPGPVELLDDWDTGEPASCSGGSTCLEQGVEASQKGRFDEAEPMLLEACREGELEGCRRLADAYAMGALGEGQWERAAALYRWSCEKRDDGQSCHSLGELIRRGVVDDGRQSALGYFEDACRLGESAGCHDRAVMWIESDDVDEAAEERAVEIFRRRCDDGLSAGCVNLAYMKAAGRGTARAHGEARELFGRECEEGDKRWERAALAGAFSPTEAAPDAYAVTAYRPVVACEQLEVLVVGGFEERVIAAFDAERDALQQCYDQARRGDERSGRIIIEADVAGDGDGIAPRIVDDELGLVAVKGCVEEMVQRHLRDRRRGGGQYTVRWFISFVHPPGGKPEEIGGHCDVEEVQMAVSNAFSALQSCGARHLERHPDDPGAVVIRWSFGPSGEVGEVAMTSTVRKEGLGSCLRDVIERLEISSFEEGSCPVQVPFSFGGGQRLHFSVVGR